MRLFVVVSVLVAFILSFGLSKWTQVSHSGDGAQKPDKILEKGDDFDPPVKITLVKSKIGVIETDKEIAADDDWLKGLTIRVRNLSDKIVTNVSIELQFRRPPNQAQELDLIAPLDYGPNPYYSPQKDSTSPPAPILPEQTQDIFLPDAQYDSLRSLLNERKYPADIKAVRIRVRSIAFSDGTVWTSGRIFKRDPNKPDDWIPLDQAQGAVGKQRSRLSDYTSRGLERGLQFMKASLIRPAPKPMQAGCPGVSSSYFSVSCDPNSDCKYLKQSILPGDPANADIRN